MAEDFLHVLYLMKEEKKNKFQKVKGIKNRQFGFSAILFQVQILCLGTYFKKFNYKAKAAKVR